MQQIHNSLFNTFVQFTVANRGIIIKRWSRAIYDEPKIRSKNNLTHQQLLEPLNPVIENLIELLTSDAYSYEKAFNDQPACHYGSTRFQHRYAINELLQEQGILRIVMVDFISEFALEVRSADSEFLSKMRSHLHKLLNKIFFASICQFSDEQRLVSECYRSELEQTNAQLGQLIIDLSSSEERLRNTFEQAAVGIAHVATNGRWLRVNKKLCEIIGYSIEEITQLTFQDITHPQDLEADLLLHQRLIAGEMSTYSIEKRYIHKNGSIIWINLTVSLVQSTNSDSNYIITIVEDITRRKMLEGELQTKVIEAEKANRAKDEIISIVSHELRTPLSAALGWSHLLSSGKLDQAGAEQAMKVIERSIKMQERLVNDLLDVGRIITGKMALDLAQVELVSLIENCLETVGPIVKEKNIKLEQIIDYTAQAVSGDQSRLQQVLLNLLTNAVKFTPEGGWIKVTLKQLGDGVELTVTDNGKGISPDFLPYVFDRFRQDVNGAKGKKGLGLGLPIARHIVEMHGGTITAESNGVGQGATFKVKLPR